MNSIVILVDGLNEEEEYNKYIFSSLKEVCEFSGLQVKSISTSGDTSYTIKLEDVVDVEFTEVIREEKNEENMQPA